MADYSINIGMRYTDGSSKTYNLSYNNETTTPASIKTKIKAINDNTSQYAAAIKATFVSSLGAPLNTIYSAKIIAQEEEVLIG